VFPYVRLDHDTILQAYPNVKTIGGDLGLQDGLALHYASTVFKPSPMFKDSTFICRVAPNTKVSVKGYSTEEQISSYLHTGQLNADYLSKKLLLERSYDWKAGHYNVFSGHLVLCTTDEAYEQESTNLIIRQRDYFVLHPCEPLFLKYLKYLTDTKNNESWANKNLLLQEFYGKHIHLLPEKYRSPSMVFHLVGDYSVDYQHPQTYKNIPFKPDTFSSNANAQEICFWCIANFSDRAIYNYTISKGINPVLYRRLLEECFEIIKSFSHNHVG